MDVKKKKVDVTEKYGADFTLEQLAKEEGWRDTVSLERAVNGQKQQKKNLNIDKTVMVLILVLAVIILTTMLTILATLW